MIRKMSALAARQDLAPKPRHVMYILPVVMSPHAKIHARYEVKFQACEYTHVGN